MKSPILFLVFNRPENALKVFERIKNVKPKKLYIAADGPRENKEGEAEKCRKTRDIIKQIDWECEVKTLFREKNLGCKNAVSSAINWFFENEESGIILEDDCLPDASFFPYCDELLERYKDENSIMMISGTNLFEDKIKTEESYFFSKDIQIWGWATWRRAWKKYDIKMATFPDFKRKNMIANLFGNKSIQRNLMHILEATFEGKIDTWDYQWIYSIWTNNGLSIVPSKNLISNIGFDSDATHTTTDYHNSGNKKISSLGKISHPKLIICDKFASELNFRLKYVLIYRLKNLFNRIAEK